MNKIEARPHPTRTHEGDTMTDHNELKIRFTYHPPKEGQPEKYQVIRSTAKSLALVIDDSCPESREKSLALNALEECVMWANAAIARRT